MDEDIALALVADQETEAASRVEPFDPAGDAKAVAIIGGAIIILGFAFGTGTLAFGEFAVVVAVRAKDSMRDKGFSSSRRTGDRRRTLSCLAHA